MSFALSYPPDQQPNPTSSTTAPARDRSREVADMIAAIPGVKGVAISDIIPLGLGRGNNDVTPEGYTGVEIVAERRFVSGEFFDVTGIRMVEGRGLNADDDRAGGPDHVVISASLARKAWPGQSAVGKRMSFWGQEPFTVIGVTEDLRDMQLRAPTEFTFYVSRLRMETGGGNILVRSDNPAAMTQTIRRRLQEAYPGVAFIDAGPMTRHIETAVAGERFRARLTQAFALCALIFCTLGVYGVITRGVASRTREFGIRMALGADQVAITRGVLRQGFAMAVVGGVLGILLAFWGTQFMRTQLYGVGDFDGVTLVAVAGLLVAIAIVATLGPAWRASHVEPTVALRSE
jgi:putative ABC transport system permease protein